MGDDQEAREFLVEVVSSWIVNGSQHLVVSFYLEEFKASTSREGWFIQEECVLNPPYSLIGTTFRQNVP